MKFDRIDALALLVICGIGVLMLVWFYLMTQTSL
jgi:hypothetical protein